MNKYMQMLLESNYADLMYRGMPKEYGEKLSALIAQEEAFQTMLSTETQTVLRQVRASQIEVSDMEHHGHFAIGFQFGVNLLLEALRQNGLT